MVKSKSIFSIQTSEVRFKNCIGTPNKEILFNAIQDKLNELQIQNLSTDLGYDVDCLPDAEYLKNLLSTIHPDHEIFSMKYVKVRPVKDDNIHLHVDNSDGFFTDLPMPKLRRGKKAKKMNTMMNLATYKPVSKQQQEEQFHSINLKKSKLDAEMKNI